jgi:hypothetical protein
MLQRYLQRARAFTSKHAGDTPPHPADATVEALWQLGVGESGSATRRSALADERDEEWGAEQELTVNTSGCASHGVSTEVVEHGWWLLDAEPDLIPCTCSGSPLPSGPTLCRHCTPSSSSLTEFAADVVPTLHFTVRETDDIVGDVGLLRRIHHLIAEQQPGINRIVLTIRTLGGRRVRVEWRALAGRELRLGIARLLATDAIRPAHIRVGGVNGCDGAGNPHLVLSA